MQHAIELTQLGPQGPAMAEAVGKCVHCGFCLSACPTYKVLGEEMDSPRGRIYLMKGVLENDLPLDDTLPSVPRLNPSAAAHSWIVRHAWSSTKRYPIPRFSARQP